MGMIDMNVTLNQNIWCGRCGKRYSSFREDPTYMYHNFVGRITHIDPNGASTTDSIDFTLCPECWDIFQDMWTNETIFESGGLR